MNSGAWSIFILKWAILISVLFLFNCTASRIVKPLKKGEQIVSASLGGSLIKFSGAPVPLPFTTLGYANGIKDRVTAFGGIHTTSLLFGNFQTDFGACLDVYSKNKLGVSITPALQTAVSYKDIHSFRVWPTLDINLRYELKKGFLYAGMHNWFEYSKTRANDTKQDKWFLPNYHFGFTKTNTKWNHQFEVKYLLPSTAIYPGVVDYIGINGKGALGIFYCIIRKF